MVNKTTILGMGNQGNLNYLIVKKEEDFFNWLKELFSSIEKDTRGKDVTINEFIDKNEKFVGKKKNIKKFTDIHEYYNMGGIRFDIFYGSKKVFIAFNCSINQRKKLMDKLDKISKFTEYKSKWKVPKALK